MQGIFRAIIIKGVKVIIDIVCQTDNWKHFASVSYTYMEFIVWTVKFQVLGEDYKLCYNIIYQLA